MYIQIVIVLRLKVKICFSTQLVLLTMAFQLSLFGGFTCNSLVL